MKYILLSALAILVSNAFLSAQITFGPTLEASPLPPPVLEFQHDFSTPNVNNTYQQGNNHGHNRGGNHGHQHGNNKGYNQSYNIVSPHDFNAMLREMKSLNFDSKKKDYALNLANTYNFTCSQIRNIIDIIDFEDSKLDIVTQAYPYIIDVQNINIVIDGFKFLSNKEKIRALR